MRHILSIAIVLCVLVLIGIFFLSDPDTVPTEPAFDMNHAQSMTNSSGDMDMHAEMDNTDMDSADMHEAMDEEMDSNMEASDMDMDAMPMEDESEMEDPMEEPMEEPMMEEEGEAAM